MMQRTNNKTGDPCNVLITKQEIQKLKSKLATDSTYFNFFPSRIIIQSLMDVVL